MLRSLSLLSPRSVAVTQRYHPAPLLRSHGHAVRHPWAWGTGHRFPRPGSGWKRQVFPRSSGIPMQTCRALRPRRASALGLRGSFLVQGVPAWAPSVSTALRFRLPPSPQRRPPPPCSYFGAPSHGLSARCLRLALESCLPKTQDSLQVAGQALPGGLSVLLDPKEGF